MVVFTPARAQVKTPAEESDAFFKTPKILNLSIDLGLKEIESLRRDPRTYVPATLKDGDKVYADVGVHIKGSAGSVRSIDDKPALTLNMNKFGVRQLFHGMDKFHLANSVQDPSYLSELICGEMFRAAGVPASRITHAVVTINGKKRGLYYLKEGYDKYFLKRHFKNADGNLYDSGFLRDIDKPLQLIVGRDDVKDHADLKALYAAAREPDVTKRFERLEKVLDMDKFIIYMAVEVLTWDEDGYPLRQNNYRIYHDKLRDKMVFFPTGMDQMYLQPRGPVVPHFQGLVARAVIETPEGRKRYLAKIGEINKSIDPQAFSKRIDEFQAMIQPVLESIDKRAGNDYPKRVNRLREGISKRTQSIEQQLEKK